jgi:hypothetical protein
MVAKFFKYAVLSWLSILIAISTFVALYILTSPSSKQIYTLGAHEKEAIGIASRYIGQYEAAHGSLPTPVEFSEWAHIHEKEYPRVAGIGLYLITSSFESDLVSVVGEPGSRDYVLNFWDGGSYVNYPSWGKNDFAYVADKDYFPFGSRYKSGLIFLSPSIFICALFIGLWAKRKLA